MMSGTLSDERMGLLFTSTIASGPCQSLTLGSRSHRTHDYILLSHLRLPQLGGPGPHIYIPQEQGGPVIPPGTVFSFVTSYNSQGYSGDILTRLHTGSTIASVCVLLIVRVKVILRPTVRPGVRHPSGTGNQFFPFSLRLFRVCWHGVPSLTRSRVCTFQVFLGFASAAFLRSESDGTHEHSLLSLFLILPQPGGPGSCIYFLQSQS
jgi:hypothetical protein